MNRHCFTFNLQKLQCMYLFKLAVLVSGFSNGRDGCSGSGSRSGRGDGGDLNWRW